MRFLLDTHVIIWTYETNAKMSAKGLASILDPTNEDFIQHAIFDNGFSVLPIEPRHCERLIGLLPHHNDPFDRLLIAQAITEDIPIISADAAFDNYPIQRHW